MLLYKTDTLQGTHIYPTKSEKENHRLKNDLGWDLFVPRRVYYIYMHMYRFMYLNSWPDRSSGKLSRTRTHFRLIEIWIEPPNFFLFQQVSSTHKHYVAMWMFFKYRHSWSWDSDHMVSMDWILMTLQWMDSYWSTSPKNCPRDPDSTNKLH